jgi:hypothetical protein
VSKPDKRYYTYSVLGYAGLVLLAVVMFRLTTFHQDTLGFSLTLIGLLLIINYLRFLEEKTGITGKGPIMIKIAFGVAVIIIATVFSRYI